MYETSSAEVMAVTTSARAQHPPCAPVRDVLSLPEAKWPQRTGQVWCRHIAAGATEAFAFTPHFSLLKGPRR